MSAAPSFVLSLGGSLVASPVPQVEYVQKIAAMLLRLRADGIVGHVVIGGGTVARTYINAARAINPQVSDAECDELGIICTRLNSKLLLSALGTAARQDIPLDTTPDAVRPGLITVMGGTFPGQTTDAVSAKLARAIGCPRMINATNVDGVYPADPRKNPGLQKYQRISHDRLIEIVGTEHRAGASFVIDPIAARIFKESNITGVVINGQDIENLERCLRGQEFNGTIIGNQ
ncbi:putative uridylate kinase [Paratrimastix pyriformis]|uniref:Uridylate kinase n=1 Tax=Paratrimastix pyriformis TaxID=342808 RepID=A0ABQ8UTF8_9EUKA|nr:putative uridylate kinase [Paratrimastix pyriformis]